MTPYFATEEDCDHFHEFFAENAGKFPTGREALLMNSGMNKGAARFFVRADLRLYTLGCVHPIVKEWHKQNPSRAAPIYSPIRETMYEFYGCDLSDVGYDVDPTEEEEEQAKDNQNEEEEEAEQERANKKSRYI